MTDSMTNNVKALMTDALHQLRPATLLEFAAEQTTPKTGPWKGRRKLTAKEALAATRVVTGLIHRFGLKPTTALVRPGRASNPGATYRFYLTEEEMAEPEKISHTQRRLSLSIEAHVENVRLIAQKARVAAPGLDEADLLDELAAAVPEFLEQFRFQQALDANEDIAADVNSIAAWLVSPRREIELLRFFGEARRQRIVFNPVTKLMEFEGHGDDPDDANVPTVPLGIRLVGSCGGERCVSDGALEPEFAIGAHVVRPEYRVVGRAHCHFAYKVGLGVVADWRVSHAQVMITLDPVTYVCEADREETQAWTPPVDAVEIAGFLVPGRAHWIGADQPQIRLQGPIERDCPWFREHLDEAIDDEWGVDDRALHARRYLEVTARRIELLLDERFQHRLAPLLAFGAVTQKTVLPDQAVLEGGVESTGFRDRFLQVLYNPEGQPSLADLLLDQAAVRCRALEEHLLRSASGGRQRRIAFRARMRR